MSVARTFLAVAALGLGLPCAAQALANEERAVLESALEARGVGKAHRVIIADRTATLSCSLSPEELIQLEGCSGMRAPQETPEQLAARLKRSLGAADETVADLRSKSEKDVAVGKPFKLAAKQTLWGPREGAKRSNLFKPDVAVSVSRVGFNKARTQALAYVATMSWTDPKGSFGEYLLLEKSRGKWAIAKRMRVWELTA